MRLRGWLTAAASLALVVVLPVHAQPARHAHVLVVVDGLRPDYVTRDVMPRVWQLGRRGIVFTAHHSVFPTVTRVNASSIVTGAYPETHGLLGNTIYVPAANSSKGLDTGERENLEAVERAEGRLLTAPTLGEMLQAGGRRLLAVSSGGTGSAYLLNHTAAGGALIHTDFSKPPELAAKIAAALGPPPAHETPNDPQNQRAIDAYLRIGVDDLRPDVTIIWLNDPDGTAHATGIGSPLTRKSLMLVDSAIGRLEDGLRQRGQLDRTNVIVTSDHGFSTESGELKLDALVAPFARTRADGSMDVVVSEGAIYVRDGDQARVAAIVAALQRRPEVGAIFTRPRGDGSPQGVIAGTLSFDVARWNHPRSGDILVSANWTDRTNSAGFRGTTTQEGLAGHGTSSPWDIHNTLIAAGPDFREHATSAIATSNVDLAPTLLRLLGMAAPASVSGRVIEEGLRDGGPPPTRSTRSVTASTPDQRYSVTAHLSIVGTARYLDYTDVTRR